MYPVPFAGMLAQMPQQGSAPPLPEAMQQLTEFAVNGVPPETEQWGAPYTEQGMESDSDEQAEGNAQAASYKTKPRRKATQKPVVRSLNKLSLAHSNPLPARSLHAIAISKRCAEGCSLGRCMCGESAVGAIAYTPRLNFQTALLRSPAGLTDHFPSHAGLRPEAPGLLQAQAWHRTESLPAVQADRCQGSVTTRDVQACLTPSNQWYTHTHTHANTPTHRCSCSW
jgi:hypothetical protein